MRSFEEGSAHLLETLYIKGSVCLAKFGAYVAKINYGFYRVILLLLMFPPA
ncbi:hypothetical protein HHE06_05450 [Helicobacter heilmannii]|nr:hypothetical protein HHE06_05450 [Helicobacter heilmannii]